MASTGIALERRLFGDDALVAARWARRPGRLAVAADGDRVLSLDRAADRRRAAADRRYFDFCTACDVTRPVERIEPQIPIGADD